MVIVIDIETCIGCGTCGGICPEVFELDEELDKSRVLEPASEADCVEDAINACPVEAISR